MNIEVTLFTLQRSKSLNNFSKLSVFIIILWNINLFPDLGLLFNCLQARSTNRLL